MQIKQLSDKLILAWKIASHLGIAWLFFRIRYAFLKRLRWFQKRYPTRQWTEIPAVRLNANNQSSLQKVGNAACLGDKVLEDAASILEGEFCLFSHKWLKLGKLPNWHSNPVTGEQSPDDRHWADLGDFDFGDVKNIWELSRFPWAFTLARAYHKTEDEKYAERFWELFEHWLEKNPPNTGINWKCGQEVSFRLMTATFAIRVMSSAVASTPKRLRAFAQFVYASGLRIEANLGYALNQKNNHGVSECVGLITVAFLIPEAKEADRWLNLGRKYLKKQLHELVYADGAFSQHSLIYHRVVLHNLTWACWQLESNETVIPQWLQKKLTDCWRFLDNLTHPETGLAPVYGNNDGSDILPLTDADYLDMRPSLFLAARLAGAQVQHAIGPCQEAVYWDRFFPTDAALVKNSQDVTVPAQRQEPSSVDGLSSLHRLGGMCILRDKQLMVTMRAVERYQHRTSHSDMLHVDLIQDGRRITVDPGSYSYNAPAPFKDRFRCARHHNVVHPEGVEPMQQVGHFLNLPWPGVTILDFDPDKRLISCAFRAYPKLNWMRKVQLLDKQSIHVTDSLENAGNEKLPVNLHWLLADRDWARINETRPHWEDSQGVQLAIQVAEGVDFQVDEVRADSKTDRGWWAPCYQQLLPTTSILLKINLKESAEIKSIFTLS